MSKAATKTEADAAAEPVKPKGGRKKLLLLALPLLLAGLGAGLWFSGILPGLLGRAPPAKAGAAEAPRAAPAVFVDLPDIVANLDAGPHKTSFIKLKARLELGGADDVAPLQAAMPRVQDLFQTYLREMRPDELRGSAGTWRLREELINRANVAIAPGHVVDVLFTEMLVQ